MALVGALFQGIKLAKFYTLLPHCFMQDAVKKRWMELCELAANEQDSQKLLALVKGSKRSISC